MLEINSFEELVASQNIIVGDPVPAILAHDLFQKVSGFRRNFLTIDGVCTSGKIKSASRISLKSYTSSYLLNGVVPVNKK